MKNWTKRRRAKEQERAQAPPSGRRTRGRLGAIRTDGRTGSATSSRKATPCEPEAEAVGLGAAPALGFHTATITATVPEMLTAVIQRAAAMQNDLELLEQIRREGSALYTELQSVKARLRSAEQTPEGRPGT